MRDEKLESPKDRSLNLQDFLINVFIISFKNFALFDNIFKYR